MSKLFSPIAFGNLTLANRIVVAPMCQYSAVDGSAGDWHLMHLGSLAMSGAGLLILEATAVEAEGRISPADLGLYSDANEAALARVIGALRAHTPIKLGMQLGHAGRKASSREPWNGGTQLAPDEPGGWLAVAPSALPHAPNEVAPAALDAAGLRRVRDAFAAAARRAGRLGLDGIEVHAAHGYLLHQFLSPLANARDDAYGGSLENRMRFPLEVVKAVRETWPKGKPLFVRISSVDDVEGGWSLDDSLVFSKELKNLRIDAIDCSSGGILGSASAPAKTVLPRVPGFQLPFSERIRKELGIKTMAVGLILDAHQAEAALRAGQADLIAVGREMLFDPNWPVHAARELGVDPDFAQWPQQYGWWLTRRESLLKKAGFR